MKHLAVFESKDAEDILNGKKSVEIRFSKTKKPPFCAISAGDLVYIKERRGEVIGQFRVKKVFFFDSPTKEDLENFQKTYNDPIVQMYGDTSIGMEVKYTTIIFITETIKFLTSPLNLSKKRVSNQWVILA